MRLSLLIIISATSLSNAFSPQSISSQHLLTTSTSGSTVFGHSSKLLVDTLLQMKKEDEAFLPSRNRRLFEDSSRPSSKVDGSLSASYIASGNVVLNGPQETNTIQNILEGLPEVANYLPVVSAALLITSNTVGASMMVLPGLAQGPGMIASSALIAGKLPTEFLRLE